MKKSIVLITTFIMIVAVTAVITVCLLTGIGRQYIIKNDQIKAGIADITNIFSVHDSEEVFNHKLNEMTGYFKSNNLNTVIIPFNHNKQAVADVGTFSNEYTQAGYLKNGDILKKLNKELKKHNIQMILSLECSTLTDEEIQRAIEEINKKYYPAGLIVENYFGTDELLGVVSEQIKNKFRNYYFGIRTDYEQAENLAQNDTMNLFIIYSDMGDYSGNYVDWKNTDFTDSKILLNCESTSFINDLFILSNFYNPDGYILTEYTTPDTDLSFYHNILDTSAKLTQFGLKVDNTFAVTCPEKDITTYANGLFVTGSADTQQPVYINGTEVATAADGTFGLYIELADGDNKIEVVQGENSITRTVTKKVWESTGEVSKKQFDDTKKAYKGQIVQTINPLTSILSDPDDDSRIIDGLQQGVQMVVTGSVKTERDGEYTWAYELSNGGYVLAKKVEWVKKNDYIPSSLENISLEKADNSNEYLVLNLTGKPAIISAFNDSQVIFTLIDTSLGDKFVEEDGEFFVTDISGLFTTECYVKQDGKNTVLVLENNTENELWGYNIEYGENDTVKIYLKEAPHKQNGAKPLEDVTIILDAGHGGYDVGALGVGGVAGPYEKDINLAVTLATRDILEKFGATVYLTRSDDTFLTLDERRNLVNEIKPDLFISQHHNSLDYTVNAAKAAGFESYYFTPQSRAVADAMTSRVTETTGRNNRGFGYGYYYVLRNDIAPCVLNEYGFVINPYEYSTLYTDVNIYKAAFGTAMAVLDIIPE